MDTTNKKYLYVTKCVIPQMHWERICDLPEPEQFRYAYITSFIKVMAHGNNRYNNVNVSYTVWSNRIGSGYLRYIEDLKAWNIISVQKNDKGQDSYEVGGHCKCFSVTLSANKSGWLSKDFKKRKSKEVDMETLVVSKITDTTDPILNYTFQSLKNLKIDDEFEIEQISNIPSDICLDETQLDLNISHIKGQIWLKKLATWDFTIGYGKNSGRLYHPVICMPKTAREHVWFQDSDVVMDYDIKSCFPVLLTAMVPESEKAEYKKVLDGDIYASIINGTSRDREDCKVAFQQFLNGFVSNYVSKWFEQHFPLTFKAIEGDYQNMSKRLQTMESNIIVKGLIPLCIQNGYTGLITCHDGWMNSGTFKHEAEVVNYVKNEIFKVCGYMPVIKASRRKQDDNPPFPIKANSDGKTVTDEEHALLLQHPTYRNVYFEMRGADRERKQWAREIHRCRGDGRVIRRQREAKRRYIRLAGEWVRLLEEYLQINKKENK